MVKKITKEKVETIPADPSMKKVGSVVVVIYINPDIGKTTREFSFETHGENFCELAKQFAAKFNGIIEE